MASTELSPGGKRCVCGNSHLVQFSAGYLRCDLCETLIARRQFDSSISEVCDESADLYGREYWYSHQRGLGYPNIEIRAREDLSERCLHWLRALLKYKTPPGRVLELGCAHGGFVALLNWAGFDACGLDLSPSIVEFARTTFGVSVFLGKLELQGFSPETFDIIAIMDVLEHFPDPSATVGKCLQLLKPDGVLLDSDPPIPAWSDVR